MDVEEPLASRSNEVSPSKVQFIPKGGDEKNGEAKVDIIGYGGDRIGLTKEELMKFANDPFWIKVRLFSFALFWIVWLATFFGSIIIVLLSPKCPVDNNSTSVLMNDTKMINYLSTTISMLDVSITTLKS